MSNTLNAIEINDLYTTLIGTLDEEKFFQSLCKEIKSSLKVDRVSATIFNSESESTLIFSSKKNSSLHARKALLSVEAQVLRTKKSYFSNSAARDPMFAHGDKSSIKTELCVPLIVADEVMGCMNLQNLSEEKQFSKIEIEKVASILEELKTPLQNLKVFFLMIDLELRLQVLNI